MHAPAPKRFRDAPPLQLRPSRLERKKEAAHRAQFKGFGALPFRGRSVTLRGRSVIRPGFLPRGDGPSRKSIWTGHRL